MDDRSRSRTSIKGAAVACLLVSTLAGRSLAQQGALPDPSPTTATTAAVTDQDKFGLPPEDSSHEFLRQESVLLKPCEWQVDVGLNYTIFDRHYTVTLPNSTPTDLRLRNRLLVMPVQIRYGLSDRIQLFGAIPVGWTNSELSTVNVGDSTANDGGVGDTNLGFSWLLHKSQGFGYSPDVVATFGVTAPSSKADLYNAILGSPQTVLGQSVWAGSWNVLFIHTIDPVVVFYGIGGWHPTTKEFSGYNVRPGDQFSYRCGAGFAVNEHVTLSGTLFGYYITESTISGLKVLGTNQEPVYLRFAVTIAQSRQRIVEPFAEIGMTDDAANTRFGVTWTF
jgi:hypothetical protein